MTGEQLVPSVRERIFVGFRDGMQTTLKMVKFVLPLYIVVDLLKGSGLLETLGSWCQPVMALFGLPGEAAFAFVAAWTINLYAAIAVMAPLDLSPWQVTQCGLMMGIAHNLIVEGGVLASTGARGGLLTLCRILLAAVAGWVLVALQAMGVS